MRRLLIVEEALRDRSGHWAEYIAQVARMHARAGDAVAVLARHDVIPELQEGLNAQPFFPASAWHVPENIARAPRWRRLLWRTGHVRRCARLLREHLRRGPVYSGIFVTSTGLSQLCTWALAAPRLSPGQCPRLVLLFLAGPGRYGAEGAPPVFGADAHLWRWALRRLAPLIREGRVVLAVENDALARELEALGRVPATVLPIPLPAELVGASPPAREQAREALCVAALGFARHERGSDVLVRALPRIRELLAQTPAAPRVRFLLQWTEGFADPGGRLWTVREAREAASGAGDVVVEQALGGGQYLRALLGADLMLLPYRSSYRIRTSRLAAECACAGIPLVCTAGTWPAQVMRRWGAGLEVPENDPEALAQAAVTMASDYPRWQQQARTQSALARAAFRDEAFLKALWESPAPSLPLPPMPWPPARGQTRPAK